MSSEESLSSTQFGPYLSFPKAADRMSADTEQWGGSSVHPTRLNFPEVGSASKPSRSKGYMVGNANDTAGHRIAGHVVQGDFSPAVAASHIVKTALQTGGDHDIYAGSWKDDNGAVVTDASERVRQHDRAARMGDERGEDAIFGLQKGNTVILKAGLAKRQAKRMVSNG
jgi:hypothetical protein